MEKNENHDVDIKKTVSKICRLMNKIEKEGDLKKVHKYVTDILNNYSILLKEEFVTIEFDLFDVKRGYHKDASLFIWPTGFSDYMGGGVSRVLLNIYNNGNNEGCSEVLDEGNKELLVDTFKKMKELKLYAKEKGLTLFESLHILEKDFESYIENADKLPYLEFNDFIYNDFDSRVA